MKFSILIGKPGETPYPEEVDGEWFRMGPEGSLYICIDKYSEKGGPCPKIVREFPPLTWRSIKRVDISW